MFVVCEECEFNVDPNAEFCPDCGTTFFDNSKNVKEDHQGINRGLLLLLTIIFGAIFSAFVIFARSDGTMDGFFKVESLWISVFIGFLIGLLVAYFVSFTKSIIDEEKIKAEKREVEGIRTETLSHKENLILQILTELGEKEDSIQHLYAETTDTFERRRFKKMLEIIECQTELCHIQENRIELARRENEFLPFTADLVDLSHEIVTQGIENGEYFQEEFKALREGFEHLESEKTFAKILPEYNKFLAELNELEEKWNDTRENLLNRQLSKPIKDMELSKRSEGNMNLAKKLSQTDSILPAIYDKLERDYFELADKV